MKILLFTHIFPPAIDGGSRVISKLGEYLINPNNSIYCLTTNCKSTDDFVNPKSTPILKNNNSKIKIVRLPVHKRLRKPLKLFNLFIPQKSNFHQYLEIFQKGPIFQIIPFIKTLFYLKNQNIELIITGPLPTTITIYANFLKYFLHSKLLINASFHETDSDFLKTPLINSLKNTDFVWSLTKHESEYFQNNFYINPNKIILAGNGIDEKFIIDPNKVNFPKSPNILFIGSLASHKRVELLINAFSDLLNIYPDLNLTIAGQKTLYFPQIQKLITKLNCKKIQFLFNFPQEKLAQLIDSSTVLVLPSIQESFGLVLIESWARGKPVISSDIPSLKELVKKTRGGLTFKTDSKKDLKNKLQKLLQNQTLCKKMGEYGLEYVRNNYTWDKVGEKIWQKISF